NSDFRYLHSSSHCVSWKFMTLTERGLFDGVNSLKLPDCINVYITNIMRTRLSCQIELTSTPRIWCELT
ncbi:MAG TPA: hypothetical protein VKH37_08630, partial [Ferruginibacter sp.]|nr:hypothetical protein [Ferruginibacter sp.]